MMALHTGIYTKARDACHVRTVSHLSLSLCAIGLYYSRMCARLLMERPLMSEGVKWVGSVMTVMLVVVWLFVGFAHIRAVYKREILWPGKDEDHDQ